jgi:hypothetical protein
VVGVGREKQVADPLPCTPPRKICVQFYGYKHTSLNFLVVKSRKLDLGSQKVRKEPKEMHAPSGFIGYSSCHVLMERLKHSARRKNGVSRGNDKRKSAER